MQHAANDARHGLEGAGMTTDPKKLRQAILTLLDSHPPVGWRDFLEEIAEDVRARIECLDEEEADEEEL